MKRAALEAGCKAHTLGAPLIESGPMWGLRSRNMVKITEKFGDSGQGSLKTVIQKEIEKAILAVSVAWGEATENEAAPSER